LGVPERIGFDYKRRGRFHTRRLQFDGFDAATNQTLRGRADLLQDKLRALDRLAEADMRRGSRARGPSTTITK
jgi:hypothetical protein